MKKSFSLLFYLAFINVVSVVCQEQYEYAEADVDYAQLQEEHKNDFLEEGYYIKENLWQSEFRGKIKAFYEALLDDEAQYIQIKILLEDFIYSHFLLEKSNYDMTSIIYHDSLFKIIKEKFNYKHSKNQLLVSATKNIFFEHKFNKMQFKNFNNICNTFTQEEWINIGKKTFKNYKISKKSFINNVKNKIIDGSTESRLDLILNISTEKELEEENKNKTDYQKILTKNDFKNNNYELLLMKDFNQKQIQISKENLKKFGYQSEQDQLLEKSKNIYLKKFKPSVNDSKVEKIYSCEGVEVEFKLPASFYKLPKNIQKIIEISRNNLMKEGIYMSDDFINKIIVSDELTGGPIYYGKYS